MAQKLSDIMTSNPRTVAGSAMLTDAARLMREDDIGDVLVVGDDQQLRGIITDRDIVVRAVAEQRDPGRTKVEDICSSDVTACRPDDDLDRAVQIMRKQAIRRLPVVEDGRPVGIVSLGDLAMERDPDSALSDISAAPGDQ
jgi:CBS domain-containing protein